MTDPISDMLTRIRNATLARHTRVDMPSSRLKAEIARILQNEGYIRASGSSSRRASAPQAQLRVFLKYGPRGERVITGIERISRPGRRVYFGREKCRSARRARHQHPDDVARRHDRPRGHQGRRRRRSAL